MTDPFLPTFRAPTPGAFLSRTRGRSLRGSLRNGSEARNRIAEMAGFTQSFQLDELMFMVLCGSVCLNTFAITHPEAGTRKSLSKYFDLSGLQCVQGST